MLRVSRKGLALPLLGAVLGLAACNEDLASSAACPALCPEQNVIVRDTVLDAVTFDTAVAGTPSLGSDVALLLMNRGDTLDTRVVLRFDSLQRRVTVNTVDTTIDAVDSAYVLLRLATTRTRISAPIRIDLYDVDTTATDTSTAALLPLFRPDRLMGGSTLDTNQVKDSLRVYLNNARLLAKIKGSGRLRLGLKVSSAASVELSFGSSNASQGAVLKYDPVPSDTAIDETTVLLRSMTPSSDVNLQSDLMDYTIVAKGPPAPAADVLVVGGLPSQRVFLRFNVPARILDSATVLRATLLLTQVPNTGFGPKDSVLLLPQLVTAGEEVTDISHVVVLFAPEPVDTLRVAATDAGVRQFEVAAALRSWSVANNPLRQQRALVLRSFDEGLTAADSRFYSLRAPASQRPRLRVSYSLQTSFGIP